LPYRDGGCLNSAGLARSERLGAARPGPMLTLRAGRAFDQMTEAAQRTPISRHTRQLAAGAYQDLIDHGFEVRRSGSAAARRCAYASQLITLAPLTQLSKSAPPSRKSTPSAPSRKSLPASPNRLSSPGPPLTKSLPGPPVRVSLPPL